MTKYCFECGDKGTEEHHVIPKSLGGTKTITLCSSCHSKVHGLGKRRDGISELTKNALYKKKIKNERVGQIPFGYRLDENNINLVEDIYEQNIIDVVFNLRKYGLSYSKIANKLEELKFKNKSGNIKWNKTQISRIINKRY